MIEGGLMFRSIRMATLAMLGMEIGKNASPDG